MGIDAARVGRIHAARLARLVDEGAIMSVPHIADLEPARRMAILVVQAVGSVSARASKYSWFDEGRDFRAASNTLKTVAVRRRKWNLR
jgi:hypothetical protein